MRNKKISYISLILSFIMIFNIFSPTLSYAIDSVDYKALVLSNIAEYGNFETPKSQFEIYVNNDKKATSPITLKTVETVEELPTSFTAKVGDAIKIKDISRTGSGTSIVARDLQIGKNYTWSGPEEFNEYSTGNLTITADKPGIWVVYLNIRDNYSGIPNFQNWSQHGNWRTTARPKFEPPGMRVEGWYFTAIKFEVEEVTKPIADFEIRYNEQNVTDNQANPVEIDSYTVTVDLIDKSNVSEGTIVEYEWQHYTSSGWQNLASTKNTSFDVNTNVKGFMLRVKSDKGVWSEWSTVHNFYSKISGETDPVEPPIPPLPPEKPDVQKAFANISIVARDNNPDTPKNEIYEGESIQFIGEAESPLGKTKYGVWGGGIKESEYGIIGVMLVYKYGH